MWWINNTWRDTGKGILGKMIPSECCHIIKPQFLFPLTQNYVCSNFSDLMSRLDSLFPYMSFYKWLTSVKLFQWEIETAQAFSKGILGTERSLWLCFTWAVGAWHRLPAHLPSLQLAVWAWLLDIQVPGFLPHENYREGRKRVKAFWHPHLVFRCGWNGSWECICQNIYLFIW